jgi:flagellar biosynthesis protein FlhA
LALVETLPKIASAKNGRDVGFAIGIVAILCVLFLPIPAFMIDIGLAFSIALSVLILMVALWIQRPLDFSSFPTILLISTMLRLSLNIATTRVILSHGAEGTNAAGYVIGGFSSLVMSGDFVIGIIVFSILLIVNFIVITKGSTRIAEVGARFTLDAIPGKQMSIDADLSAGLINEKEAQFRRRELEEESAFFGSMDGASKFVRGDAIAGLIITAVNVVGGIIIGYARHDMSLGEGSRRLRQTVRRRRSRHPDPGAYRFARRRPAGFASGGQTRHQPNKAVVDQLSRLSARARHCRPAMLLMVLALVPGLPFLPFAALGGLIMAALPAGSFRCAQGRGSRRRTCRSPNSAATGRGQAEEDKRNSVKQALKNAGNRASARQAGLDPPARRHIRNSPSASARCARNSPTQYGFVVPEIKVSDDISHPRQGLSYQASTARPSHRTPAARRRGAGHHRRRPQRPCLKCRATTCANPPSACAAVSVIEMFHRRPQARGLPPDPTTCLGGAHPSERGDPQQPAAASVLQGRQDRCIDRLRIPNTRSWRTRSAPRTCPILGLQAVLKLLLAERVSIRNLHLILEAVAETCAACPQAPSRSSSMSGCGWRSRSAATCRTTA